MARIILKNNELNAEKAKTLLIQNGLKQTYSLQNGELIIKETDVIQVSVTVKDGQIFIQDKFPTIGNGVQIVVTILLIALFIGLDGGLGIEIPFPWLLSIGLGQLVSYLWFSPKIKKLQEEVVKILQRE